MAASPTRALLGPIGRRLAVAFVAVAVGGVAVLAGMTLVAARSEVSTLVARQQDERAAAVAQALARAYQDVGGWAGADVRPAVALAVTAGATLEVRDRSGQLLPLTGGHMQSMAGLHHGRVQALAPPREVTVVVAGTPVGTAVLRFPAGAPAPEREVRDALVRAVGAGAVVASLAALVVAVLVSRRITRPLVRLTEMARAMEAGDLGARAGGLRAPGELGQLAEAADRMAEALAREDALRRNVMADVAHELRTPVTILRGSCEELLEGAEAPTPERLASLHDEVLRLGRMVEDLEALAQAEAAGLHLSRSTVDLAAVAGEAAELLRPRFLAGDLTLETRLTPVTVEGDPVRLNQVVSNLLINSAKFTPAGGRVTVEVGGDGSHARLVVSDTGPGMAADELPHVFERFWRGRSSASSGGSGIGLAVVDELVRAHQGVVEVESRPGQGARFTVRLPLAR